MIDTHKRARLATLSAIALIAAFCCISVAGAALAEATWRPDAWITAKTKIALATDDRVDANDVNVDTVNGRVTLHGKVRSPEIKTQAEQIARGIEGTVEVRNLLQVVATDERKTTNREDAEIRDAVKAAIDDDPELKSSSIEVQSVNDGVVLLGGSADSLLAHLEAIRTASRVEGVHRVETQAETGDRLYDEKLWRDPDTDRSVLGSAADAASRTGGAIVDAGKATGNAIGDAGKATAGAIGGAAGAVRDTTRDAADKTGEIAAGARDETVDAASTTSGAFRDAWITTATKARLLADPDTPAMSINVDTSNGVVTLFGTVPSEQARSEAIAHAKAVTGSTAVNDQLTIDETAIAGDDVEKRPSDDQLAERVRSELDSARGLADADIEVEVEDGIAQLSGTVPNHEIKMSAATTARSIDGVRAVENKIRVQPKS